jgi:DNA-binding NtrC family response regulator
MKEFRQDLFYRCSVLRFEVRPLRARRAELPDILRNMVRRSTPHGTRVPEITHEAMAALQAYAWPGNFRELENVLQTALLLADGGNIEISHLPSIHRTGDPARTPEPHRRYVAPADPADPADEAHLIHEALRQEGGNRNRAARRLGMSRATLWIKLHQYPWEPAE